MLEKSPHFCNGPRGWSVENQQLQVSALASAGREPLRCARDWALPDMPFPPAMDAWSANVWAAESREEWEAYLLGLVRIIIPSEAIGGPFAEASRGLRRRFNLTDVDMWQATGTEEGFIPVFRLMSRGTAWAAFYE